MSVHALCFKKHIPTFEVRYRLKWELQTLEKNGSNRIFSDFIKLLLDESQSPETLKQARLRLTQLKHHQDPKISGIALNLLGEYYQHRATIEERKILDEGRQYSSLQEFYKQASEKDYVFAEMNLGYLYYPYPQHEFKARQLFHKAANKGEPSAYFGLSETQIFDVEANYNKATEAGFALAQFALGLRYEFGRRGMKQDITQAVSYYKQAANQGLASAQSHLGACYLQGNGLPKNESAAVELFQQSAMQDCIYGLDNLALCYRNGFGIASDIKRAILLWKKTLLAEPKSRHAEYEMNALVKNGHFNKAELEKESFEQYQQAAQKDTTALIYMAFCYQYGTFNCNDNDTTHNLLTNNILKAIEFYKYALHAGHLESSKWELIACYQFLQNEGRIEKERLLAVIQSLEFISTNKGDVNNCLTLKEREDSRIENEKGKGPETPSSYFPYFEACAIKQHTGLPTSIVRYIRSF